MASILLLLEMVGTFHVDTDQKHNKCESLLAIIIDGLEFVQESGELLGN